jgi:hypothetical protein
MMRDYSPGMRLIRSLSVCRFFSTQCPKVPRAHTVLMMKSFRRKGCLGESIAYFRVLVLIMVSAARVSFRALTRGIVERSVACDVVGG